MPVVEIHLVRARHSAAQHETLLTATSRRYAEIAGMPVERVRAFLTLHEPEHWATGGVPDAVDGDPAPYFVALVLDGGPAEQRHRLLAALTDVVVDVLGATRSRVRGRLVRVAPEDWAVGGVPAASSTRRTEVVASSTFL